MAFTTIQGSGANDATSFVGSAGVDAVNITNIDSKVFAGAQASADNITLTNFKALVTEYTLKGGQGTDTLTLGAVQLNTSFVNANSNNDTVTFGNATTSTVHGGQGNDTFTAGAGTSVTSGIVNGNRGNDTLTLIGAQAASAYGGRGADTITTGGAVNQTTISGNLDGDNINIGAFSAAGSTINGNGGNDNITTAATTSLGASYFGGAGNDTITGATATGTGVSLFGDVGNDTIAGSALADAINGGVGNDTIQGNALADTLAGGGGGDRFNQAAGATAAFSVTSSGAAVLANGDAFTVAADVISDFGTDDQIATGVGAGARTVAAVGTALAAANFTIRGDYAAATGVFTTNITGGADTLVITGTAADFRILASLGTNATVLTGNGATGVAAGQFV